jgi:peptide/nickel transport system substrate-binding protein
MRRARSWILLCASLACSAGCQPSAASRPPRLLPEGELRVFLPSRPDTLNPNISFDEMAYVVGRNVFSQLLALNESGRLLPELAASWAISPDGLIYTFYLRQNVRWHDGVPLTSADVRWTLEAIARDGVARDALLPVEAIETPDRFTVRVRLRHPWAPFASNLAGFGMFILPRHRYEHGDWRSNPANEAPIGSGPFRFVRRDEAGTIVLDANENYFRSGPYVRRLLFRIAPPAELDTSLLAEQGDVAVIRPADFDPKQPPAPPLTSRTLPSSARTYLAFNLRRPPLDDLRVRRAIASAIDRLALVLEALQGQAAPAVGWYTPDVEWAYNAEARVPDYDLAAARRLLAEARRARRSGAPLRFTLSAPVLSPYPAIARQLQQQLARAGIALDVELQSVFELTSRVFGNADFDLVLVNGIQGPDPDSLRTRFLADTASGAYIGYRSPAFREAVERGARTLDYAERAAAYYRAQEILAEDVPFVPLVEHVKVIVYNQRVSGLPQLEAQELVGALVPEVAAHGTPSLA